MDYQKIGRADDLSGADRKLYRRLEILPGFLSWLTLLGLTILAYFTPVFVAYFIIAFNVYWLLLVVYLGIHLVYSYGQMRKNSRVDWKQALADINRQDPVLPPDCLVRQGLSADDLLHIVFLPTHKESREVVETCVQGLIDDGYDPGKMIVVLAQEERSGPEFIQRANDIKEQYGHRFRNFLVTVHPDGLAGEIKGKGSNQAWAAKIARRELIDKQGLDYGRLIVSVFDVDTIVKPGYFHCLTYKFLTVSDPYRASYQPVPMYHNNVWQAPFFARGAASSNTFWQMMQQIRQEKLATYSSHSMSWQALADIGFWSTNMVSEDSRIFWHCFIHYNGKYRVEPLHFPVSMDVTMDESAWQTAKNLYKQQRRWGWGVENVPYLLFNMIKRWRQIPRGPFISRALVQIYGFHSWATNALIIGVIGWLPMLLGGDRFNVTVLSVNLPVVSRTLMMMAMAGLVLSAILSTLLLPRRPSKYGLGKYLAMIGQWLVLPFTIIIFGSIPGLDAQTRLMLGKYLGFWVTPKKR